MTTTTSSRVGQVWKETSETGTHDVGVVVESKFDKYLIGYRHTLAILDSDDPQRVGLSQSWNEDDLTKLWDTYEGLERLM